MNNYAFISLLYPNKQGDWTFLEGALLTALGLRKQNVQGKIICMVTPDVSDEIATILKIVYDEVRPVEYISPLEKAGIKICGDIFNLSTYTNENNYTDMCNIFTKLHIFDSEKFPYDKLIFIDNDLIPLNNFDELSKSNVPAGWLEKIIEIEEKLSKPRYTRMWGIWNNILHNKLIPKNLTDIYKEPGSSINAGLMVIKPDVNVFKKMIEKLQSPKETWFGPNHKHKGMIGLDRLFSDRYHFPEQDFLTQEFSGQWHMIDGKYCAWGAHTNEEIYGMHMAGLKYEINDKWINYKSWMVQIPIEDGFNKTTNETVIWGLNKYPELKSVLMKNLKIICGKNLIEFDKIPFFVFLNLTNSQQELHNFLYDKFNVNYSLL
jgi:hypothetical protein